MTTGFHDVDALVAEAIEGGDFCYARKLVSQNHEVLSRKGKELLLDAINEAEAKAIAAPS